MEQLHMKFSALNIDFDGLSLLIRALSPLLNGRLHHWYIVSALKTIIYHNIICFCLQTSKMNVTLNVIQFSYKN